MLIQGDCLQVLQSYDSETFDLIVTDPPYGISFMGKDWDRALPKPEVWTECFRVLKEGKMAFIMCSPRQDVLSRMIISLETAGFRTNYTSIYWTYASGFPKAANISKLIDKKNGRYFDTKVKDYLNLKRKEKGLSFGQINEYLGTATNGGGVASALMGDKENNELPTLEVYNKLKSLLELDNRFDELIERTEAEREIIGYDKKADLKEHVYFGDLDKAKQKGKSIGYGSWDITKPATQEAKKMEGAYVGFQPKPAVEVILVCSKGKSLTWLDDCRIPYSSDSDKDSINRVNTENSFKTRFSADTSNEGWKRDSHSNYTNDFNINQKGRFPANLLVSSPNPFGEYARYFDLDKWWATALTTRFIITPKASKSERNKGLENLEPKLKHWHNYEGRDPTNPKNWLSKNQTFMQNFHPTVKPLKLMSYLITMGSREGDLVLDPFVGSGTTYLAALQLHRKCIGIELNPEYIEIAKARVKPYLEQTKINQ